MSNGCGRSPVLPRERGENMAPPPPHLWIRLRRPPQRATPFQRRPVRCRRWSRRSQMTPPQPGQDSCSLQEMRMKLQGHHTQAKDKGPDAINTSPSCKNPPAVAPQHGENLGYNHGLPSPLQRPVKRRNLPEVLQQFILRARCGEKRSGPS